MQNLQSAAPSLENLQTLRIHWMLKQQDVQGKNTVGPSPDCFMLLVDTKCHGSGLSMSAGPIKSYVPVSCLEGMVNQCVSKTKHTDTCWSFSMRVFFFFFPPSWHTVYFYFLLLKTSLFGWRALNPTSSWRLHKSVPSQGFKLGTQSPKSLDSLQFDNML